MRARWLPSRLRFSPQTPGLLTATILFLTASARPSRAAPLLEAPFYVTAIDATCADPSAGHLDRDGRIDLAIATAGNRVQLLRNAGGGFFEHMPDLPSASGLERAHLIDLDRDGLGDLVLAGAFGVSVRLGEGDGAFAPEAILQSGPADLDAVDFDRDGVTDLVTHRIGATRAYRGRGDGTFDFASEIATDEGRFTVSDVTGDGIPDLLQVRILLPRSPDVEIRAYPGAGDGTFGTPITSAIRVTESFYDGIGRMAVGRFDDDAFGDLVVYLKDERIPDFASDWSYLFRNLGDGHFEVTYLYGHVNPPGSVLARDLDGDGRDEALFTQEVEVDATSPRRFVSILSNLQLRNFGFGARGVCGLTMADAIGDGVADLVMCGQELSVASGRMMRELEDFPFNITAPDEPVLTDINRDGLLDVLVGVDRGVELALGDGTGLFPRLPLRPIVAGAEAPFRVAELDRDPHLDLVGIDGSVWLGDGAGSFRLVAWVDPGGDMTAIAVGDLNHDAVPDLVFSGIPGTFINAGDGTGHFTRVQRLDVFNIGSRHLTLADLNHDGEVDLVTQDAIVLGRGGWAYDPPTSVGDDLVAVEDFNRDGDLDLVTAGAEIHPGRGDGTFGPGVGIDPPMSLMAPPNVVVTDIDGNGRPDIAARGGVFGSHVTLFLNQSDGSFLISGGYGVGYSTDGIRALAAGDMNGDGRVDLVGTTRGFDALGVGATLITLLNVHVPNRSPDAGAATAAWSGRRRPRHDLVPVDIGGVTDPDGDAVTLEFTAVTQDEPLGRQCPDAAIVDGRLYLRQEREGRGNGRVYRIHLVARDAHGGVGAGVVSLCVPHDRGPGTAEILERDIEYRAGRSKRSDCVDDGQRYASFGPCLAGASSDLIGHFTEPVLALKSVERSPEGLAVEFSLPAEGDLALALYDVAGRRVAAAPPLHHGPGAHRESIPLSHLPSGVYWCRIRFGAETRTRILIANRR